MSEFPIELARVRDDSCCRVEDTLQLATCRSSSSERQSRDCCNNRLGFLGRVFSSTATTRLAAVLLTRYLSTITTRVRVTVRVKVRVG